MTHNKLPLALTVLAVLACPHGQITIAMEFPWLRGSENNDQRARDVDNDSPEGSNTDSQDGPSCAICTTTNITKPIVCLSCHPTHRFHLYCLGSLILSNSKTHQSNTCPLCRKSIQGFSNMGTRRGRVYIDGYPALNDKEIHQASTLLNRRLWKQQDLANAFGQEEIIQDDEDANVSYEELMAQAHAHAENVEGLAQAARQRIARDAEEKERQARTRERNQLLAKLLPSELIAAFANSFIARTLFEADILTSNEDAKRNTGIGVMSIIFIGTNLLLQKLNPQRLDHKGKTFACWATGIAMGGFLLPNALKNKVDKK